MENNIKLSITSPVGATLNTSGKYCDSDIEVIPYLQEKTVTESGEVLPDEGYAGLSKVMVNVQNSGVDTSADTVTAETMLEGVTAHDASGEPITGTIPTYDGAMQEGLESYPKFQEKTATENGEVLPDEGFDGLSKVTVNVPSTGGGDSTYYFSEFGAPVAIKGMLCETFTADLRQGKIALPETIISYIQENINDETKAFIADIYIDGLTRKDGDSTMYHYPKFTFMASGGYSQSFDYSEGATYAIGTTYYVRVNSFDTTLNEEFTELSFSAVRSDVNTKNINNAVYLQPLDFSIDENSEIECTIFYKWVQLEEFA